MRALEEIVMEAIARDKTPIGSIPSGLLNRIARVESGGDPRAVSPAGAQGMYQLMPGTARELGVRNPFDPVESRAGAERYLRQLHRQFSDWRLAAMAYHAGPGNVAKWLRGQRSRVGPKSLAYPGLLGL